MERVLRGFKSHSPGNWLAAFGVRGKMETQKTTEIYTIESGI